MQGEWGAGRVAFRTGQANEAPGVPPTLPGLALLTWIEGPFEAAQGHGRAFLGIARRRGDMQLLSYTLATLADWAFQLDRPADAKAPAREAAELVRVGGR